jgi:hypothetical protein
MVSRGKTVVLLFGSGGDANESSALTSEQSMLKQAVASDGNRTNVDVVSLGLSRPVEGARRHLELSLGGTSPVDKLLRAVGAFALRKRFAKFPLGRLLNSMGPVDPGRVFWRSVRRNGEALAMLRAADLLIAADLAATKTAWIAANRRWVAEAHYDHRSAAAASTGIPSQA